MNKKILISALISIIFSAIVLASYNVEVIVNIAPGSCYESDGGADYSVKGNISALAVVPAYWPPGSNITLPVSTEDLCNGEILYEGVCGSSYGYPNIGGILNLNCSSIGNNYSCVNGACVQQTSPPTPPPTNNTNSTNSTLPLVALWHFNEGNGIITLDSSGNVNTGTINGATWTTGYLGSALDFDGNNDLVTTLHTPSIDVTNAIEIEAWVRHDAQGYGTIVSKNGPYILAIYNDKVHGGVYANDGLCNISCVTYNTWTEIDGTTNLQVGVWYKLKMKYNGSTVKVYVNDVLENSAPKIGQMPQVSQNLNIGWGDPGQNHYFSGIIDEVSIRGY